MRIPTVSPLFRDNANLIRRRGGNLMLMQLPKSPGIGFDLTSIASLTLLLEADNWTTLYQDTGGTTPATDANQRIARWDDRSGGGNNVTQSTAAAQGYYQPIGINGFPGVQLAPAAEDWNYLASGSILSSSFNTAFTLFYAGQQSADDLRVAFSANSDRAEVSAYFEQERIDTSQLTPAYFYHGAQALPNNFRAVGVSYDGSHLRTIINGHLIERAVTGNLGLSGALTIGNLTTPADRNWRGYLGGVYLWQGAATATQMRNFCAFLMHKYGYSQPVLKAVVYHGDSLTAGEGTTPSQRWPSALAAGSLGYTDMSHHIAGQPGAGIAWLDTVVAPDQVDPVFDSALTNSIYVSWMGTNDIAGPSGDANSTYTLLLTAIAHRVSAGAKHVIVLTMLPRTGAGDDANTETRRIAYNTLIRNGAGANNYTVADVAGDNRIGDAGDQMDTTYYLSDHVHLNSTGRGIIAGIVGPLISGLL